MRHDTAKVAALKHAFMIDSGAQVTAVPLKMATDKGYTLTRSEITGLRILDGSPVAHHGKVELRAKRGDDVLQVAAEVADVDYPVLSTDAVTRSGRSVLHTPEGDWIVDGTIKPPADMTVLKLKKYHSACYLEFDEILHASASDEGDARLAPLRRTLASRTAPDADALALPKVLGPDVDDNVLLKAQVVKAPRQPSETERQLHNATHLPFRSWCPECVQGRARGKDHAKVEAKEDSVAPRVEMDFFFLWTDELAIRYAMKDGVFLKERDVRKVTKEVKDNLLTVLNVVDRRSLAQITLPGDKKSLKSDQLC